MILLLINQNGTVTGLVSISVRAEDEDGDGDIQTVEFSLNGSSWQALNGAGVWSHTWDSETVADGVYELHFRAFDGTDHSDVSMVIVTVANGGGGSDDDDDDGIDQNILLGAGGLVIVVILLVVILMARGRKDDDGEPCPDCGTGLDYVDEYESWYCGECEEYKE